MPSHYSASFNKVLFWGMLCFLSIFLGSHPKLFAEVLCGDPGSFALRFNETTGNPAAIVFRGKTISLGDGSGQMFDISKEGKWIFGGSKPRLIELVHEETNKVAATMEVGDFTVVFLYEADPVTATLFRRARLTWNGKETTKVKGFWMSLPVFSFEKEGACFVPGQYPPKRNILEDMPEGGKASSHRGTASLVCQRDRTCSILLFSDNLCATADRFSSTAERREGGVRLSQSFDVKAIMKPGVTQELGMVCMQLVAGDGEAALRAFHPLMQRLGHVVPVDRPEWFKSAILYSFHPGGTTGSRFTDLGGFKAALPLLERIKEIGCNAIWIMPVEDRSPYHPRDYYKLQEGLGTPEEYKQLVRRAHELGLQVIQDCVPHGGSNTYPRALEHPEWLVREEDGSTLSYWCFDFNWPSWLEYMANVAAHYVKEYDIDGYRVDAVSGSKIPNWNPKIPYDRASHSQSQGGLNMLRSLRKAVKDLKPKEGGLLAEVNGSVYGAVSDATYDFDLCYNVFHDLRKQPAPEFVTRIRRWLYEQQYSEIADLLRLRHVESHDALRARLWFGIEPARALLALTATIHGIPLVYQEQEDGNAPWFHNVFALRRALPEMQAGETDYLAVDAPPGVFACIRSKGSDASIVLINFNETPTAGKVSVAPDALPQALRQGAFFRLIEPWAHTDHVQTVTKSGARLEWDYNAPQYGLTVITLRREERSLASLSPEALGLKFFENSFPKTGPTPPASDSKESILLSAGKTSVRIDRLTGLMEVMECDGKPLLGKADLFLPESMKNQAGRAEVIENEKTVRVRRSFGKAVLEMDYTKQADGSIRLASRWNGEIPKNAALALPVFDARSWGVQTAEGLLFDRYFVRHLAIDGTPSSIYWRPQGTNVFYDSVLEPVLPGQQMSFATGQGLRFRFLSTEQLPARIRLLDRVGDRHELTLLISWCDDESPLSRCFADIPKVPAFAVGFGGETLKQDLKPLRGIHPPRPRDSLNAGPSIRPTAGGWMIENEHYRLRLGRNGTITRLCSKNDNKERVLIERGDLYSDYGYGNEEKLRYSALNDVETGNRMIRDGNRLILRFEGQLRGFYRFALMRPPIDYAFEYHLDDGPGIGLICSTTTHRPATDSRGFLSLFLPMPEIDSFAYYREKTRLDEGRNTEVKGRAGQRDRDFPERIVFRSGDRTLLEMHRLEGELGKMFFNGESFFIAMDDGQATSIPNRTRTFRTFLVPMAEKQSKAGRSDTTKLVTWSEEIFPQKPLAVQPESADSLVIDGGFEQATERSLVSIRTGYILPDYKKNYSWSIPPQGSIVSQSRSGHSAAQVHGEIAQYRLFSQNISLQSLPAGTKLRLSAWVKGENIEKGPEPWQVACLRFAAAVDGKMHYTSSSSLLGTFDWKRVSVEIAVPEKSQSLSIQAGINGASGTLLIDEVELLRIP